MNNDSKQKKKAIILSMLLVFSLTTVIVFGSVAMAASWRTETKTLTFRDITIQLNGQCITPKDANGKVVEPFIIDGTTYLPLRAVSEALGLEVDWDGNTSTVFLSEGGNSTSSKYPPAIFISGEVADLYLNPKNREATEYEKKYDDAFFLMMYGEFSNTGNFFVKLDAIYDIYPENKADIQSKLSAMEVYSYKDAAYVCLVNLNQYFRQRNIDFKIDYHNHPDFVIIEK